MADESARWQAGYSSPTAILNTADAETFDPPPVRQEFRRCPAGFVARPLGLQGHRHRAGRTDAGEWLRPRRARTPGPRPGVCPAHLGSVEPETLRWQERHRPDAGQLPLGSSRRLRQFQGTHAELGQVRGRIDVLHALLPGGPADGAGPHQPPHRALHLSLPPLAGALSRRSPSLARDPLERGLPHRPGQRHIPPAQALLRLLAGVR